MSRIISTVLASVAIVLLLLLWWEYRYLLPKPKVAEQSPEIALAESERYCLEVLAYDDGKTALQHTFMAHAVLNLSEQTGLTVCEIFKQKTTLAAPSEEGKKAPRYPEAAAWLEGLPMYGDPGNAARAKLEVARILKERRQDYNKYPCLAVIQRYIRPPKWGTYQDEKKMEAEMTRVYEDGQGAKFYGPRGSTAVCK
ncbi:hypothetical protein HYW59_04560 [Candidatus Kaiserbacteria bacterium]|nr:hypothetical protein [Candidatus Kaiserbacteria bacterium]